MKKIVLVLLVLGSLSAHSQSESGVDVQANLLSGQYWRGIVFSNIPCLQPEVTFYKDNFSFNLWAIGAFNGKYFEVDFTPAYTIGNVTLWACDYYCPEYGEENRFFDFTSENSRHSAEFAIEYEAGLIPLNLLAGTFFYGDTNETTNKPYYSTYIQAGYPFSIAGIDAEVELGITPWGGYYADKFSLVHAGFGLSYEFGLKNGFYLPANLSLKVNPDASFAFVTLSIGISKSFSKVR